MKKIIVVSTAFAGLLSAFVLPGMALARETGEIEIEHGIEISDDRVGRVEIRGGATGTVDMRSERGEEEESEHATTTRGKSEDEHGTSTRGKSEDEHGTSTASSSKGRGSEESEDSNNENGFGKGGLVGFFRWMFGLPDDTTVGEIRAEMQATTSATTTSSSQGLGFFARLFGFFGL